MSYPSGFPVESLISFLKYTGFFFKKNNRKYRNDHIDALIHVVRFHVPPKINSSLSNLNKNLEHFTIGRL